MRHDSLILIRGAGDLATGAAYRLHKAGFPVVMTELPQPLVVRRTVSFAEAVFAGQAVVEGVRATRVPGTDEALACARAGTVAVLVDPEGTAIRALRPWAVIDGRLA